MNVVLYTWDMEPITIIDLPIWALQHGEKEGTVNVEVMEDIPTAPYEIDPDTAPTFFRARAVCLEFHRLYMPGGRTSWLITVHDDVLALKLRPAWLPGQRAKINDYERTTRELASMLVSALKGRL